MEKTPRHRLTVCTSCKTRAAGQITRPGFDLIASVQRAIDIAGDGLAQSFAIGGAACMAGCERPCTIAFHGTTKASYLFGDITVEDVQDIVAFARQYAVLQDGWCSSVDRPGKLRHTTLARVPATVAATIPEAHP